MTSNHPESHRRSYADRPKAALDNLPPNYRMGTIKEISLACDRWLEERSGRRSKALKSKEEKA